MKLEHVILVVYFSVHRQQREEILRKKEKMEMMLKKGKRGEGGVRPESPTGRRKRPTWHRGPTLHFKPRLTQHTQSEVGDEIVEGQAQCCRLAVV